MLSLRAFSELLHSEDRLVPAELLDGIRTPFAAHEVFDTVIGARPARPRARYAQRVEVLSDLLVTPALGLQVKDVEPDLQLPLVTGGDPNVAAGLSHHEPRRQFLNDSA